MWHCRYMATLFKQTDHSKCNDCWYLSSTTQWDFLQLSIQTLVYRNVIRYYYILYLIPRSSMAVLQAIEVLVNKRNLVARPDQTWWTWRHTGMKGLHAMHDASSTLYTWALMKLDCCLHSGMYTRTWFWRAWVVILFSDTSSCLIHMPWSRDFLMQLVRPIASMSSSFYYCVRWMMPWDFISHLTTCSVISGLPQAGNSLQEWRRACCLGTNTYIYSSLILSQKLF